MAATVDRYFAICHAHSYKKNVDGTITTTTIAICWLLGVAIGVLPMFGWSKNIEKTCSTKEAYEKYYVIFLCISASLFPGLILAVSQLVIYMKIKAQVE